MYSINYIRVCHMSGKEAYTILRNETEQNETKRGEIEQN